jgi:DNA helicase-4
MINKATDVIKSNRPNYTYQYIIIDEYQDISFARFNLIKEIRDLSGARLVCVGDD